MSLCHDPSPFFFGKPRRIMANLSKARGEIRTIRGKARRCFPCPEHASTSRANTQPKEEKTGEIVHDQRCLDFKASLR